MNKPSRLMTLQALTFLHPGTGQHTGVVDLPVQREVHTGFPMIQSSGLKGSLRDAAEQHYGKPAQGITDVFGSDNAETAGALTVSDGRLLAFPVRSLQQVFVWITCPLVLQRLERDLRFADVRNRDLIAQQPDLKECLEKLNQHPLQAGAVVAPAKSGFVSPLVLEEQALTLQQTRQNDENAADKLALLLPLLCRGLQVNRLVIVTDDDFRYFVRYATQVSARLNNHQLKAGGLRIGGLNRRLKEKAAESRWFVPRAKRPSGGLKPPYGNQAK